MDESLSSSEIRSPRRRVHTRRDYPQKPDLPPAEARPSENPSDWLLSSENPVPSSEALNRRLRSSDSDPATSPPTGTSPSQLPLELTLIVLGTGVAIGLVVIGIIWCVCYLVNRRYYATKERKKLEKEHEQRLLGYSGPNIQSQYPTQYLYLSGSGKDKEKQRSTSQLVPVPLPTPLPTPVQVQVQLVHTDQGVTTQRCLLDSNSISVENLDFVSEYNAVPRLGSFPRMRNSLEKPRFLDTTTNTAGDDGLSQRVSPDSGNEKKFERIITSEKINIFPQPSDAHGSVESGNSKAHDGQVEKKEYMNITTTSSLVQVCEIVQPVTVDRSASVAPSTASQDVGLRSPTATDNQNGETAANGVTETGFLPEIATAGSSGTPGSSSSPHRTRLKTRTSSGHPLMHPNFHSHSNEDLPIPPDPDQPEQSGTPHAVISPLAVSTSEIPGPSNASPKRSPTGIRKTSLSRRKSSGTSRTGEPRVKIDAAESPLDNDPCVALWNLRTELENKTPSPGDLLLSVCSERSDDGNELTIRLIPDSSSESGLHALLTSQSTTTDECYTSTTPISDDLFTIAALQAAAARGSSNVPVSLLTSLTSFESNTPSEESFDATSCAKALEAIFDEPSDLPGPSISKSAASGWSAGSSGTHLTPPVQHNRQKRKQTPPKLTSHQKRQSFKKAHHLAADRSTKLQKDTTAATAPVKPDAGQQEKAMDVEKTEVVVVEQVVVLAPVPRPNRTRSDAVSPSRLQQMKNDSGYKSQSFDTATAGHSHAIVAAMHAYKSVPALCGPGVIEMGEVQQLIESRLERDTLAPVMDAPLTTSSEYEDLTDCSIELSDAFLSLTSSMEDPSQIWRSSTSHSTHHKTIPLVRTLPATPTSPSPAVRDWAIDAQSDRLFREFSQPNRSLTPPTGKSGGRERGRDRQHRVPGSKPRSKLKSYSPSSSHGGTSAQASIEETEEEESLSSGSTSTMSQNTVIQVENESLKSEQSNRDSPTPSVLEAEKTDTAAPLPDFFICSTREQVFNRISIRSRSPQLRHVPIIKLPDQESDEV